jgi:hypothetical protein
VTCPTQPCRPCACIHILHYIPQGDESSPRGSWGICAPDLPEVLTSNPVEVAEYAAAKSLRDTPDFCGGPHMSSRSAVELFLL